MLLRLTATVPAYACWLHATKVLLLSFPPILPGHPGADLSLACQWTHAHTKMMRHNAGALKLGTSHAAQSLLLN